MVSWPTQPVCHEFDVLASPIAPYSWTKNVGPYPYDCCSYCGSISPETLFDALLDDGAKLEGADWKYSWPHKFYVRDWHTNAKWYNVHFLDLDDEAFDLLGPVVSEASGIEWFKNENAQIIYKAPYFGYVKETQFEVPDFLWPENE